MNDEERLAAMLQIDRAAAQAHDIFAGLFAGILMQLHAVLDLPIENVEVRAQCLGRAEDLARQGLRQTRELAQTKTVDDGSVEDFVVAVRTLVEALTLDSQIRGAFETRGEMRPIKNTVAVTLERILEEAISNTRRHAHAKRVAVQLCFEDDQVVLEISDDGIGFVPDQCLVFGFGLLGLRARVDRLGGGIWLRSSPGKGTKIRVDLPNPYADE